MYYQDNYLRQLYNMQNDINSQIQQAERMRQQPALTQNFQIAPASNNFKLVKGEEDVEKELVITDTYFLTNSLENLWIKNPRGEIRTFRLEEIVAKDEKDIMIENLQKQIDELKGSVKNVDTTNAKPNGNTETNSNASKTISRNVSDIPTSKTKWS